MKVSGLRLAEGYQIPPWYGVSYRSPCSDHIICHLIPFNFLVRWGRSFKWWFKSEPTKGDALSDAYLAGKRDFRTSEQRQNQRVAAVIEMLRGDK